MSRFEELTAGQAFEIVLDRLVSEQKERYADLDARVEAQASLREAQQLLQAERQTRAQLESALKKYANADDTFTKLYDAAEAAAKELHAIAGKNNIHGGSTIAGYLESAVAAAKNYIDPLPF